MGNQLAGIAPFQIFPVEHYLTDLPDFSYDSNLGSTRFFKVARAKHKEGLTVMKVFAIHDPTLPLRAHKERVEAILKSLGGVSNCLPFKKALLTDKSGILVRQYVKDNLYDRLSTRPFLNSIEKRWIAFQLLYTLSECHKLGICHGDIKLENIMITGWNWVLLTDFASFKPTYLPEDNPADFSYFFDTSRRRTCYIAPERFVKTLNPEVVHSATGNNLLLPEEIKKGDITPAMDIFSLGCAFTELFTDGCIPFDFSQLLAYRGGEYSPWKVYEKIEDLHIRELVRHMTQKDPSLRLSAADYLEQQREKAFPAYFYSFLRDYIRTFSVAPLLAPDDKITRLKRDMKTIIQVLVCEDTSRSSEGEVKRKSSFVKCGSGLVVIMSLVTSCLRSLKHCSAKLYALEVIQEMAGHLAPEIILDRLLPYMLYLVNDQYPLVRIKSIQTLTECLSLVKSVPRSDANIFPEYIFPNLADITQDQQGIVRMAFAENIAALAETALKFLEMAQVESDSDQTDSTHENHHHQASYDSELQILQEIVQESVSTLLSDPDNAVKQMLLERGITRLCVFFGRQKANDILLSHMITFLNDKEDRNLRRAFFESIVGVAAYVGWQCCSILKPLLQQGMADPEEFVISKTLNTMSELAELGLIQKQMLYELVTETVPLLCHPNLWIRQGAVGFVCTVARTLNLADIQCKLVPLLQPFLKHPVIQLDKEVVLLDAIEEPLPRGLFDYLIKLPVIVNVLDSLRKRQLLKSIVRPGHQRVHEEIDVPLKTIYRRLQSEGMTEANEDRILALSDHLLKIHKYKASISENKLESKEEARVINLAQIGFAGTLHSFDLSAAKNQQQTNKKSLKKINSSLDSSNGAMNEEWQHMFGSTDSQILGSKTPTDDIISPTKSDDVCDITPELGQEAANVKSFWNGTDKLPSPSKKCIPDYCCVPCRQELGLIQLKKQNEFLRDEQLKDSLDISSREKLRQSKWRPKGILVAHLHEHRSAVNRLQVIPESTLFATCSNDGTVKVWDCGKLEGRSVANRSRQTYNRMDGQVTSLTVCQSLQSLAAASETGAIHVFRIEANSPKSSILYTRSLEMHEEGCAVDMSYYDAGSQAVLVYATVRGAIVGWDLRAPGNAWKLENHPKNGLITSLCINRQHSWLVIGTDRGKHICWDMRFQLPITTVTHPRGARIRRMMIHSQSSVMSASQWNNEVTLWDMETGARPLTLWASTAPPLSLTQASNHSTCCLYMDPSYNGPYMYVVTAGTDMRIRYWDLNEPTKSSIVVGAVNDPPSPGVVSYTSRLIDGTEVIYESYGRPKVSSMAEELPRRYPEVPAVGHHDIISDIAFLQTTQNFMVSASRDGVVKVWK